MRPEVVPHPDSGRLLISGQGTAEIISIAHGTLAIEQSAAFELDSAVITTSAWPNDRRLALAAGTTISDWRAVAALFDPAARRFVPGTQVLGHGIIPRIREDPEGRLWRLLPWAAEVLRLTPH